MRKLTSWISNLFNPDIHFACGFCSYTDIKFHSRFPYYSLGPIKHEFALGFMYHVLSVESNLYHNVRARDYSLAYNRRMTILTFAHLKAIEEYAGFNEEVYYSEAVSEGRRHIAKARHLGMVPDEYFLTHVYPVSTHNDRIFNLFLSHLGETNACNR